MAEPAYLRATRAAYDIVADDYAEVLKDLLAGSPTDRAFLATFAELVLAAGDGLVGDLGCGPGRLTGHLHSLGLDVFGVDLSPAMVAAARRACPGLRFEEGSFAALDLADGALGGIVAWYSIIHTPPELLPEVFGEFRRVLGAGGYLLLAFQVGDERVRVEQAYGHAVSADAYRLPPDRVVELLGRAGFVVGARMVREPEEPEKTRQAYLLARKPG
jgi:SAM-dependent methyltransferase